MKRRIVYLLLAILTMLVGLASRRFRQHLPTFIGEYSGDVLWALMLFLVVSFVLAGRPLFQRCIISLVLAFAVEVSQLYHAPWIDSIRNTTLGGLVLGFGFLWSDLVCYMLGVAAGVFADRFLWLPAQRENTN
jgi:threonine/homoserine/homoserine lactone efflux protein